MSLRVRRPRVSEKREQAAIVQALRAVGATVYVLGHPPRRDAVHKGTMQTPGIPDLCAHLPISASNCRAHQLWVECKAKGGRLSEAQKSFRDFCVLAGEPHLVGGLDVVLQYLTERGYLRRTA